MKMHSPSGVCSDYATVRSRVPPVNDRANEAASDTTCGRARVIL